MITLEQALTLASEAHHQFEQSLGHKDENWPTWYANYIRALDLDLCHVDHISANQSPISQPDATTYHLIYPSDRRVTADDLIQMATDNLLANPEYDGTPIHVSNVAVAIEILQDAGAIRLAGKLPCEFLYPESPRCMHCGKPRGEQFCDTRTNVERTSYAMG